MRWYDRNRRIFYVNWTHKSAEQWSQSEIAVCEGWAAHKGKNIGKNAKQLKATFRCALNSKKELLEIHRSKNQRFWQFIDPSQHEILKKIKSEPKEEDSLFANFDSCGTSVEDNMSSPPQPSTSLITVFKQEDLSDSCSPHSEDSRSSPLIDQTQLPAYQYPTLTTRVQPATTDLWQPNFMTIPQGLQDLPGFAQFSNGLDELIRPMCQELTAVGNPPLRQTEMDQFVPALDGFQSYPAAVVQQGCANKIQNCNAQCQSMDEDYLLDFDVDPEACEKLIKELNRLTTT